MFHQTYVDIMHKCMQYKALYPDFQPLNLSTMTIIGGINKSSIDIQYLSEHFVSPVHPACVLKRTKKHGDYIETKRGKIKKSFYNQITIQYQDITTKSIKIFSNGKLQVTGATSLNEASAIAKTVSDILNSIFDKTDYKVISLEIGMINTNFSFGRKIDIIQLRNIISHTENTSIDYEPDVYPGLKIKHNKTSIFVFMTGNVLITGVKSLDEVRDSFDFIVSNTFNNWKALEIGQSTIKKTTFKGNYIEGYKENEYNCATAWNF